MLRLAEKNQKMLKKQKKKKTKKNKIGLRTVYFSNSPYAIEF